METLEKTKLETPDPVITQKAEKLIDQIEMHIKTCNLIYFGEEDRPFIVIPNNDKEVLEAVAKKFNASIRPPSSLATNYFSIYLKDDCYEIMVKSKDYDPVVTYKLKD